MSNTFTKFIDSCVGAIARKVQDEFDESKHPRDKGGRFSSKGGEGRGGAGKKPKADKPQVEETDFEKEAKEELNGKKGNVITTSMEFTGDEEDAKQLAKKYGFDYKLKYPKGSPYATIEMTGDKDALRKYAVNEGFGSEEDAREFVPELFEGDEESGSEGADDDEGYMGLSKEELAEEEEYENARERARREKDDDRVTGPEDRDYMNEEDDDADAHSAVKLGSPEHESIRQNYMSALTGSVPSLDSRVRVKWALDQVDNVIRRFGTESAKNRLMGIVYNVVGLKNSGDKGQVYKQLSDYIKEFE